jgi:hypothetical protein
VSLVLALSQHTGTRIAEVAFLLLVIAGVWLVAAEIPRLGIARTRVIVAGVLLATSGLLLIVATRWGGFG